ncbi:MAG TPA: bifunctional alpha,alpha-trehalose-phosphate synthase (UDP-forming)/trehalose-phosphatase [Chitinophagaceae bacterium]|jgi:trehalose 6-phosphate synthase/phosphatase|nr:bifunctional alpha,alpha-trehalose-phosphate synthase (UDP-forming)/trehalose-phosphatase [Chitinophagaceae bacterium]
MGRLLIISNRLPFSIDKVEEDLVVRQSSGGLVSAIKSYFERCRDADRYSGRIWIGSMDSSEEDWNIVRDMGTIPEDFGLEPVFPARELYNDYYNGFSNSTLWPLFHYFPSLVEYRDACFEAYRQVNNLFAERIAAVYQPGDVIWVHDYQLMLLPWMLRQRIPDAAIGFFLHIPFPSYEVFRLMPTVWKRELLRGLMGADLIGFHTQDYVQHFVQSARMILQVENQFNNIYFDNRTLRVDVFPIGIDYHRFREACVDETVVGICTSLEEKFISQKIIFSVDRLDYTKGLNYRLDAFEHFLQQHPEWLEKVVFILNVIPSRDVIPTYSDRKRGIEEKVSTINGKYSTLHWQPLIYRYNHLSFEELCALYQVADVALITPLRDGMNLVAKEYIASCMDKGVLVLSELTGAAQELSEAILVNPTDVREVSNAIQTALDMSLSEQRTRLAYMQRRLRDYDVEKWTNDFLEQLKNIKEEQVHLESRILDSKLMDELTHRYVQSRRRCILLDYDGTLSPYHKVPAQAIPGREVLQLLEELTRDEGNEVIIISGRDADTLEKWLGHLPLNLVAEHGAAIRYKGNGWQLQTTHSAAWKEEIRPVLEGFTTRCAGSFIEEKKNSLAWHYRNTHPDLGFSRSRELRNTLVQLTNNTPLQVVDGNKVLEVRLVGVDKGATSTLMLHQFQPDFVLSLGDDTTDEDMFRALRDKGFTIKVGRGNTAAQYTLLRQTEVLPLLRRLISATRKEQYGYTQV